MCCFLPYTQFHKRLKISFDSYVCIPHTYAPQFGFPFISKTGKTLMK